MQITLGTMEARTSRNFIAEGKREVGDSAVQRARHNFCVAASGPPESWLRHVCGCHCPQLVAGQARMRPSWLGALLRRSQNLATMCCAPTPCGVGKRPPRCSCSGFRGCQESAGGPRARAPGEAARSAEEGGAEGGAGGAGARQRTPSYRAADERHRAQVCARGLFVQALCRRAMLWVGLLLLMHAAQL